MQPGSAELEVGKQQGLAVSPLDLLISPGTALTLGIYSLVMGLLTWVTMEIVTDPSLLCTTVFVTCWNTHTCTIDKRSYVRPYQRLSVRSLCAKSHLHGFHLQVFLGDFWRGWWLVAVLGRMRRAWGWIRLTAKLTKFSLYVFYSSKQSKQMKNITQILIN